MKHWHIRSVRPGDIDALSAWRAPGADVAVPQEGQGELWLLAHAGESVAPGAAVLLGACVRLRCAIGLEDPRHWYHVGSVVHAARELKLFHCQNTLVLGNDYTGASELADLAVNTLELDVDEQASALRALLRASLLVIARERQAFATPLIAELPGVRAQGRSPFWDGLGRHFYAGDPVQATQQFGHLWRGHVAALLPRQPVYTSFLSEEAQAAIAQAPASAHVCMQALLAEGLRYGHHVTIDDAGPVFEARLDTLDGLMKAQLRRVHMAREPAAPSTDGASRDAAWLVAMPTAADACAVHQVRARLLDQALLVNTATGIEIADTAMHWTVPLG